ncbi:hypothetical protein WJX79_006880 [Trebouxia sp. C0005]
MLNGKPRISPLRSKQPFNLLFRLRQRETTAAPPSAHINQVRILYECLPPTSLVCKVEPPDTHLCRFTPSGTYLVAFGPVSRELVVYRHKAPNCSFHGEPPAGWAPPNAGSFDSHFRQVFRVTLAHGTETLVKDFLLTLHDERFLLVIKTSPPTHGESIAAGVPSVPVIESTTLVLEQAQNHESSCTALAAAQEEAKLAEAVRQQATSAQQELESLRGPHEAVLSELAVAKGRLSAFDESCQHSLDRVQTLSAALQEAHQAKEAALQQAASMKEALLRSEAESAAQLAGESARRAQAEEAVEQYIAAHYASQAAAQEQAAALLSQLHQQDPSRGTPQLQPHPRGTLHQVERRPAHQSLTPGMGSVGSISPGRGAGRHRGREGEISCRIFEQQPWPSATPQAGQNPSFLTPGMGSVGSISPRGLSASSSDLDPLTGASGVGRGRPRDSPESNTGGLDGSPVSAKRHARDMSESDQENQMPTRFLEDSSQFQLKQHSSSGQGRGPLQHMHFNSLFDQTGSTHEVDD